MIVENGGFGAAGAAPIAKLALDYYLLGKRPDDKAKELLKTMDQDVPSEARVEAESDEEDPQSDNAPTGNAPTPTLPNNPKPPAALPTNSAPTNPSNAATSGNSNANSTTKK